MPYFPALILGLILTAYWGRVVRFVYKIRRSTGRSANYAPSERLGLLLRLIWNPAVVAWIILPYLTAFHLKVPALFSPLPSLFSSVIGWAASAVAVSAFAATWICWKRMGKSWRMGISPTEKTQLIVSGPYAYVRHPIYALSSLLMLMSLLIIPSPLMLLVAAIHLCLLQWEARREEKYLTLQHGQAYTDYCRSTGRFIPRTLRPYDPACE